MQDAEGLEATVVPVAGGLDPFADTNLDAPMPFWAGLDENAFAAVLHHEPVAEHVGNAALDERRWSIGSEARHLSNNLSNNNRRHCTREND